MAPVTTRRRPKPFSWSYSKLKNYTTCPKRHWHVDIQRDIVEEESEHLVYGNEAHKHMAARVGAGTPLPEPYAHLEKAAAMVTPGGKILVEQKLAITADFGPCGFFDDRAWYRGIADVVKIVGPVALVIDWKTGKIVEDSVQLALMAQCVFAHYPEVQKIRTMFAWLKEDADTREDFMRADMPKLWAGLLPRVREMEQAAKDVNFPPKPGSLCRKWCPVKQCPHNGE